MIPMNASTPPCPSSTSTRRLEVVILAAGLSSRLGRPKALARVGGVSLLRRSFILTGTLPARPPHAVVPPRAHRYRREAQGLGAGVRFVVNPDRAAGLSTSVRRGIVAVRFASAVLIVPVDLAVSKPRDLMALIRRWRAAPRRLVARRIASPRLTAFHGGAPLILPKWLFGRALEATGDTGLRGIIDTLPPDAVTLVDLPSAELDVDTAEDLDEARRRSLRADPLSTPAG